MHGRLKLEKRTPNDADDAGRHHQHHEHHWGPVSPSARLLGCLCPLTGPGLMGFLNVGCWNHGYHESSRVLWWVCHGDIDG